MEHPQYSVTPERPKNNVELAVERLNNQEGVTLEGWSDLKKINNELGIKIHNPLDPQDSNPSYKGVKEHMEALERKALGILFDIDRQKGPYREKGLIIES